MIQDKDINRHEKPRETLFSYDNGSQLHSESLIYRWNFTCQRILLFIKEGQQSMRIRRRNVSVKNVLIGREVNAYVDDNLIIDKS